VLKKLNQKQEEIVKNNIIIMYMSFGANPLLKKEFIKYVLENNILRLNNIKLSEKIYNIFGSTRNYKKETKLTQTDANNMLKRVSSNQLSSKVRTLKAENRRLRHFNRKFKDTLATGIRWENAINDVESMSKSMVKGG
jgi:regulator of replication initiation timing